MTAGAPPLWTATEVASATGGEAVGAWQASGVSIDSRTLAEGDLFVALKGPNFDGHDYVLDAARVGACASVVSDTSKLPEDLPRVVVHDSFVALERLGRHARERSNARVCCVTGSVGKTGTKEALARALGAFGKTHASSGNLNNQWGVPLSLARMPADAAYGVFELGMNHPGELGPLSRLARPHVAVITTVAAAHLEFFDSVAAIADAKAEIFEGMGADGTAVLNRDNAYFALLATSATDHGVGRVIGFGAHGEADVRLVDLALDDGEARVRASVAGRMVGYSLRAVGRHWAFNSLAVLAAAHALDADVARAAAALADFEPPKGRGRLFRIAMKGGELDLIDESYNASPAATRAALAVLADIRTGGSEGVEGRRIAVLGDMLELGPGSDRLHAALAHHILAAGVDIVFCVGRHMGALYAALPEDLRGSHALRTEDLVGDVLSAVKPGDVVLIKGSLGTRMAPMVEALKALNGSTARGRPNQSAG